LSTATILETFVQSSLYTYGSYTINDRAIPDVRDGLKPVQRRILWSMQGMGLKPQGGSIKCARIVGDTIGKYHPHGDASVYDALTSMATPWTHKHPLIAAQGNFGSVLGDPAAAYRYTEAGITEAGHAHFTDKAFLTMQDNFDGTETEPEVLSSLVPMLLANGYSGIAMGFSGSIPAHSIREVTQAAIDNLAGRLPSLSHPQLEQKCFLLSTQAEIDEMYASGVGTMSYCSHYELDDKNLKARVLGLAPGVTFEKLCKKLDNVVETGLVKLEDYTGETIDIHITVKDTRLFQERVLPALKGKESYSFYVITPDGLRRLNVKGILEEWQAYRIQIWERRIKDTKDRLTKAKGEIDTQIAIIQNRDAFVQAISQPTMTEVRSALSQWIQPDFIDYALSLRIESILALNEKKLTSKSKELAKDIAYWTKTTPKAELTKQLEEILKTLPVEDPTTVMVQESELPQFTKVKMVKQWVLSYGGRLEVSTDQPTRGRGFAGNCVAEVESLFSILNRLGGIETVSVHALPKKYAFQTEKTEPLVIIPEGFAYVAARTTDGCLFIRPVDEAVRGYKELSKDPKIFEDAVLLQPGESLTLRYRSGGIKVLTPDQIDKRASAKSVKAVPEMKGFQNPLVAMFVDNKVKEFTVGDRNFCTLVGGQRQILTRQQVLEAGETIEQLYRLC
jgi:DNA gyrase subunit A